MIEIGKMNGETIATIYEPGKYQLGWSSGKTTTASLLKQTPSEEISGKWTVHFDTLWGGPQTMQLDTLKSWTDFENNGVKYYSGTALYKKQFSVTDLQLKGNKVVLDLGNVLEMAAIKINGNELPVKWNAPFQFDISHFIRQGFNQLEVSVVNLWPNRLIGDSKLPVEKRLTKTNVLKYEAADSEKLLRPSGLLGPVKIIFLKSDKIVAQ